VDNHRDELDLMAMQATLFEEGAHVVPGSRTFGPGANAFDVPLFNTLTIELWGAGGGGSSITALTVSASPGGAGGATSLSSLGLTANGGGVDAAGKGGGAGGGAGGGTTNVAGGAGASGSISGSTITQGASGTCNGINGGNGFSVTLSSVGGSHCDSVNGGAASPGGGSSGCAFASTGTPSGDNFASGGGGGGYCKKVFTSVAALVKYQDVLSFVVGAGGTPGGAFDVTVAATFGNGFHSISGGAGGAGQITFTWS